MADRTAGTKMAEAGLMPLLQVSDLTVCYSGEVTALRGVNLTLEAGESVAVVGESGSGKSTLAQALAGLVQPPDARGSVRLAGQELLGAPGETLRTLRWNSVALALQGSPFNPVVRVGEQVAEPLREHRGMDRRPARARAEELATEVLLEPALLDRYPHQLSVGQRRRAALAMVLTLDPELVVLDEPTSGLDPATTAGLVEAIRRLAAERGFALLVCTHTLPDAAKLAERAVVLYGGQVMEAGRSAVVLGDPVHPYTWALVNAYPLMSTTKDLRPIRGRPPDARDLPPGCPFHPRCTQADTVCTEREVTPAPSAGRDVACHFGGLQTLLSASEISKTFRARGEQVCAVRSVGLSLREGESVGVVGPSGSGKSTLARILAGHLAPDAGEIRLQGEPLPTSWGRGQRAMRRRIQLVMQDPWDALSPRLTVRDLVGEPLDIGGSDGREQRDTAVTTALEDVGLPGSGPFLDARSHELSGGQLQRVALARALVAQPKVLVADEPTSMLDASEQARLLVVLRDAQIQRGLGLVLVSHDLAAVRKVTDRIVVLEAGQVVEAGPSHRVATNPQSITGRRLLDAAPDLIADDPTAEPSHLTNDRSS
ncbi:MAG: ATP-binding cassette domain-containing protein [Pseudonocardiaceae bacterium]|nr:ATP-binding cassette domain-containing protein [Pseudonocardiaceae bacterium]